jgi:hypothetical protein
MIYSVRPGEPSEKTTESFESSPFIRSRLMPCAMAVIDVKLLVPNKFN